MFNSIYTIPKKIILYNNKLFLTFKKNGNFRTNQRTN